MPVLHLILLIFAFICFLLAGLGIAVPRVNLIALGLAAWMLTLLVR